MIPVQSMSNRPMILWPPQWEKQTQKINSKENSLYKSDWEMNRKIKRRNNNNMHKNFFIFPFNLWKNKKEKKHYLAASLSLVKQWFPNWVHLFLCCFPPNPFTPPLPLYFLVLFWRQSLFKGTCSILFACAIFYCALYTFILCIFFSLVILSIYLFSFVFLFLGRRKGEFKKQKSID